MDLGLKGKRALVMGASQGIGYGIARELISEGAKVAVSSSSPERIEASAKKLGALGIAHDSLDLDAAPSLVERVERELGPIDILVTNTGGPPSGPDPLGFSRKEWEDAYRSLVLSPVEMLGLVLPGMRERKFGRVVNVASVTVREPSPILTLSNAHRSATVSAFKTVARAVAEDGVTVNTVAPGRIATDRLFELYGSRQAAEEMAKEEIPTKRLGTVEEFAAAVTFLCSERASYVTGAVWLVDGGLSRSV